MTTYTVTAKTITPTEPAAFFGLRNYDPDAVVEFEHSDGSAAEVYSIETDVDLDRFLDMAPGVIVYEKS